MLINYEKETGIIVGINTSPIATFDNMYPDATEEFKQKYGGILVDCNDDYDKNRSWYKVENGEVTKRSEPFIQKDTRSENFNIRDQRISDLEIAIASILGGAV